MEHGFDEQRVRQQYRRLTLQLIEKSLTITTMESATAGQIASLLTDTEGASAILKGAFVTYSNEAKIRQGVPAAVIEAHSVYSPETARAMAVACREAYTADIGIGITGTMGNVDPANAAASVPGNVYFALDVRSAVTDHHEQIPAQPTRLAYKLVVAGMIADALEMRLRQSGLV